MKKFIAVLLAVLMMAAFAIPTFAAEYAVEEPKWVTIDGVVTEEEWGKPIYKGLTFEAAEDQLVDDIVTCWWYDGSNNQRTTFDLYVTNTNDYIYLACVQHNVERDMQKEGYDWMHQVFWFSFSEYHEDTTVRRIEYKGKYYEAYTGFLLRLMPDGTKKAVCQSQGINAKELWSGDYEIKYDPATRTMTYEVGIPMNSRYTYFNNKTMDTLALSVCMATSMDENTVNGSTNGSNRIHIGTGCAFKQSGDISFNYLGTGNSGTSHYKQCVLIKMIDSGTVDEIELARGEEEDPTVKVIPDEDVTLADALRSIPVINIGGISVSLLVLVAAVVLILICAVVVTVVLVKRRNKREAK